MPRVEQRAQRSGRSYHEPVTDERVHDPQADRDEFMLGFKVQVMPKGVEDQVKDVRDRDRLIG